MSDSYRSSDCPNCGRHRVQADGVCEKCDWDADGGDYVGITRPAYCPRSPTGVHEMAPGAFGEACKYCTRG